MNQELGERVNVLDSFSDFTKLQEELDIIDPKTNLPFHETVGVVGGGFLGTEIALGCLSHGRKVYHLYTENGVLSGYVPSYLSSHMLGLLTKAGIVCKPDSIVKKLELERTRSLNLGQGLSYNRIRIKRFHKQQLLLNYVALASTHIEADVTNAHDSGLKVDPTTKGLAVNEYLQSSDDIFVAGNAASWEGASGNMRRVSRYDHAKRSGTVAGRNMSNSKNMRKYDYEPGFRSNFLVLDTRIAGVGEIDSSLYTTVGVWDSNLDEPASECTSAFNKGIIYYLDDKRIVGCLLWNTDKYAGLARKLLSNPDASKVKDIMELKTKIDIGPEEILNVMVEKKPKKTFKDIKQWLSNGDINALRGRR